MILTVTVEEKLIFYTSEHCPVMKLMARSVRT